MDDKLITQRKRLAMGEKLTGKKLADGGSVNWEGKDDPMDRDVLAEEVKEDEGTIHTEDMFANGGSVGEDEDVMAETKRNPDDRDDLEEEDKETEGPHSVDHFDTGGKVKSGIAISIHPVKVHTDAEGRPDAMEREDSMGGRAKRAHGGRMKHLAKGGVLGGMKHQGIDNY